MQTPKFAFHKLLVLLVSSQYFRQTSTAPLQLPNKVCQKAGVAILLVDPYFLLKQFDPGLAIAWSS